MNSSFAMRSEFNGVDMGSIITISFDPSKIYVLYGSSDFANLHKMKYFSKNNNIQRGIEKSSEHVKYIMVLNSQWLLYW